MFDPYHKWLGIPKDQRPPTLYQLLGVSPDEADVEVIEEAAVRQTTHIRAYQIGAHAAECTRILNEISQARQTLLNPAKRKDYDEKLVKQGKLPRAGGGDIAAAVSAGPPPRNVFEEMGDGADTEPMRRPRELRPRSIEKSGGWVLPAAIAGGVALAVLMVVTATLLVHRVRHEAVVAEVPVPPVEALPSPAPMPGPPVEVMPPPNPPPNPAMLPMNPPMNPPIIPAIPAVDPLEGKNKGMRLLKQVNRGANANNLKVFLAADGKKALVVQSGNVLAMTPQRWEQPEMLAVPHQRVLAASGDASRLLLMRGLSLVLFNAQTRQEQILDGGMGAFVSTAAFSADGKWFATAAAAGRAAGQVWLWDLATANVKKRLTPHAKSVIALGFSEDGAKLYSLGSQENVATYDINQDRALGSIRLENFLRGAFAANGKYFVGRATTGGLHVYELPGLKQRFVHHTQGHFVTDFGFSADGRFLVVSRYSSKKNNPNARAEVLVLDAASGEVLGQAGSPALRVLSVDMAAGGLVATGDSSGTVSLWQYEGIDGAGPAVAKAGNAEPVPHELARFTVPAGIDSLAWASPNIVLLGGNPPIVFDLAKGKGLRMLGNQQAPARVGIVASADGQTAFFARENRQIERFDVPSNNRTAMLGVPAGPAVLALSPDAQTLVFARSDSLLSFWDMANNGSRERRTVEPKLGVSRPPLVCLAIAPDSKRVFSGHRSGAFLWDLQSGALLGSHINFEVFGAAYHPSGELVIAVPWELMVMDEALNIKRRMPSRYAQLKFTPDGKYLVALDADKRLAVLGWPGLQPVRSYSGQYTTFAVAPDSRSVVAYDGQVGLHRLALPDGQVALVPNIPGVKPEVKAPDAVKVTRKPAPAESERQQAQTKLRGDLAKEYAKKTPLERLALAQKLLKMREEAKDSAERFVILTEANELAASAGRTTVALKAIEELADEFDIEALGLKQAAFDAVIKYPGLTAEGARELADAALAASREATLADKYEAALGFVATAKAIAPKTVSVAYKTLAEKQETNIQETSKEFVAVRKAEELLKAQPNDAGANLLVGKFLSLRKGEWERGLPLLAKGGEGELPALAREDLKNPADSKAQMDLGDSWHGAGDKETEFLKPMLQQRALYWYRQAVPHSAGQALTKLHERIKVLEEATAAFTVKERMQELRKVRGHGGPVTALAISPDGKKLLSGSMDAYVKFWELPSLRQSLALLNQFPVVSLALSPDQNHLAVCSDNKRLRIYDYRAGDPNSRREFTSVPGAFWADDDTIYRVDGPVLWSHRMTNSLGSGRGVQTANPRACVIAPDRQWLAVLADAEVVLFRMGPNAPVGAAISLPVKDIGTAAFSSDNRLLALADKDGLIHIHDVNSKQELKTLIGHQGAVRALTFVSTGRLLSGGQDRSLRVWDAAAGREITRVLQPTAVNALAVAPGGRRVFSAGSDAYIREWELPPEGK